jgi:hypothetical protein
MLLLPLMAVIVAACRQNGRSSGIAQSILRSIEHEDTRVVSRSKILCRDIARGRGSSKTHITVRLSSAETM